MISQSAPQNGPQKAPPKRSLFSKPSWSSAKNLESADLFHRADQTYVKSSREVQLEKEKKLERKLKEKQREAHRESEERSPKRQRISSDEDEEENEEDNENNREIESEHVRDDDIAQRDLQKLSSTKPPQITYDERSILSPSEYEAAILSTVDTLDRTGSIFGNRPPKSLIDKDSNVANGAYDDDDVVEIKKVSKSKPDSEVVEIRKPNGQEEDDRLSDEEFPELAKKAREKAQRRRLERELSASGGTSNTAGHKEMSPISDGISPRPSQIIDPVLEILVTSELPETLPIMFKRKLSQRFKDIRLLWMSRQQLGDVSPDDVFLTWRGKRIFDVTTCQSLGLVVDTYGNVVVQSDPFGETEGRIQVEAVTAAILEARKKSQTQKRLEEEEARQKEEAEAAQEAANKFAEGRIRIILKAKGYEDFKTIVKPVRCLSLPHPRR